MDTVTVRRRRRLFVATKRNDKPWTLSPLSTAPPVTVNVRCGGRMHTIKLTKHGALVLCDHKDKAYDEAISVQATLGGPKNRCKQILAGWRQGYSHPDLNRVRWNWYGRKSDRGYVPRKICIVKPNGKKHKHITGDPLARGNAVSRERDSNDAGMQYAFQSAVYRHAFTYRVDVKVESRPKPTILKAAIVRNKPPTPRLAETCHLTIGVPLRWHKQVGDHKHLAGHVVIELGKLTETSHSTSYFAKLIRIIETERGPLPVMQMANVYKKGRGWIVVWQARSKPELPLKISFT